MSSGLSPQRADAETPPAPGNWLGIAVFAALWLWLVGLTWLVHGLGWLGDQFALLSGGRWTSWLWPLLSFLQAVLILLPTLPLALLWREPRFRAVFRLWAVAGLFMLLLLPVKFVQPPAGQVANLLQIAAGLLAAAALLLQRRRAATRPVVPGGRWLDGALIAAASSAVILAPWLAWGALGSVLDSILNAVAGLLLGFAVALLLENFLLDTVRESSSGPGRDYLLIGLAGGAAVLLLASAFGYGGSQLLLMLLLPALTWIAGGLEAFDTAGKGHAGWLPLALLFGIASTGPLMFVDPDELMLLLSIGTRDVLYWAFLAALASAAIALILALSLFVLRRRAPDGKARHRLTASAIASWLLVLSIYAVLGQPGFYGEELFVIFKDQADLARATTIANHDARRQYVYEQLTAHAVNSQSQIRASLDRLNIHYRPYYLVNAIAVRGGPFLRQWLARRPEVDRVLDNPVLRPLPMASPPSTGAAHQPDSVPWNLTSIGADKVWRSLGITGVGIVIGISDSGVDGDHPELTAKYRGRNSGNDYNWFDPWNHSQRPTDTSGHGTHTLATAVGASTGVAPGAQWIGCVNLYRNLGNPAFYLDCLQFMLAPFPLGGDPFTDGDPTKSAHILNNSWGCTDLEGCDPESLAPAAEALQAAGIFVVASAGNEGPRCASVQGPLAIYEDVLSVGAVDRSGMVSSFSSRGPVTVDGSGRPKPDLVAPGERVLSAFPRGTYEYLDGTSMAGPHVAGVVALMWSANPGLIGDVGLTSQLLEDTAQDYTGPLPACVISTGAPNNATGFGIVDAYAAVKAALNLP